MAAPTSLKDTRVKRFSPVGTSDSRDETEEFPGACSALTNLVPDLTTRNLWLCRPASVLDIDFSTWPGITNPGVVSVFKVVGSVAYGLCGDLTAGTDKPFAYNLLTGAFLTVTLSGSPVFPTIIANIATVSTLPTMALIGSGLQITHPNYPLTSAGCRGRFNISVPLSPSYATGDVTGAVTFVGIGKIPDWVVQFGQRAYYGCNLPSQPSVVASDVLNAGVVTNAGQVLTFGNNLPLTIAAPLGLSNQLGGIIQSLMVFQGFANIQQITGDFALTGGWSVNTLNVATGVVSQRAVCSTPQGLAFMSPDGMRIIDPNGTVSDPIGSAGTGVVQPFTYLNGDPVNRLMFAMGSNAVTIRVSVWDFAGMATPVEYWYNMVRKSWSGPHTPITSFEIETWNGTFLIVGNPLSTTTNGIYKSNTNQSSSSTYTENGVALTFRMQTVLLADNAEMAQSELVEMQIMSCRGLASFSLQTVINNENFIPLTSAATQIGTVGLYPTQITFSSPVVFNRMSIAYSGPSSLDATLGDTWVRMRTLGYIVTNPT